MRKVTQQIKEAFEQRKAKTIGNTRTDGESVWLHGNEIVRRDVSGLVFATLAGWNTPTTRERVNGITGLGFHQVNFEACLNGQPIDSSAWFVKCHDGASASLPPPPKSITIK
ncbi:MAG: hypothetical protein CMK37_08280 [Porticoccaceae bacterium]|nr:hypothetical protein [Porticoccaceae bacterium]|tara:strand:- start:1194 stop:1529 length:336 start_codon:yes stop_codon:yes gene_type:complete